MSEAPDGSAVAYAVLAVVFAIGILVGVVVA